VRIFDQHWLTESIVGEMRRVAKLGVSQGQRADRPYLERCKGFCTQSGIVLIFSRDTGHHSSGWWKNPDYERCWHLSISLADPYTLERAPRSQKIHDHWVEAFYRDNARSVWTEAPFSDVGKKHDVWHYRLFVEPDWETVIVPRGEVYSKAFTEKGWLSYSDLKAAQEMPSPTPSSTRKEKR
jgi:hypothetical protein